MNNVFYKNLSTGIVGSLIGGLLLKFFLDIGLISTIIITESLIIIVFLLISNKKIRSMYFLKYYGPHQGYQLLRTGGNKVYLIKGNIKRWIKDPDTLFELGYDFDMINLVSREELDRYHEEKPISIFWDR